MARKPKNKKTNPGNLTVVKWGLILLLIILSVTVLKLIGQLNRSAKITKNTDPAKASAESSNSEAIGEVPWTSYKRNDYGFSVEYPATLYINDLGKVGWYIDFIRFEEGNSVNEKGIALGVSQLTIKNEVEKIRAKIDEEGGARLEKLSEVEYKGSTAIRLDYKPENPATDEERVIYVFGRGSYTFSVSTVPEQIEKVLENFSFTK